MKITVFKFDPAVDAAPYYVTGEVEWRKRMTALEALVEFHENIQAVNFDYSCACRLCGRCTMMLNGEPAYICVTPIENKDYTFEPLEGYPVIRDLTVDKSSLDNMLSTIFNRVRIEAFTKETVVPASFNPSHRPHLYATEFCTRCGACTPKCQGLEAFPSEFIGPAAMLAIAYRFFDPLDQADRVMEAVSNGLYRCNMCGNCDIYCAQQDIKHLEIWQILRDEAAKRGIVPSYEK